MMIAQGKRSAALGSGRKMIPSFFPSGVALLWRPKPEGKKRLGGGLFTQGGGLGGLALGYYLSAPPGRRKGESGRRED
jgi:hypothetical protein